MITVGIGEFQKLTISSKKAVINSPRVNTYTLGIDTETGASPKPFLQVAEEAIDIPVKMSTHRHHLIEEPGDLLNLEMIPLKGSENCPA